MKTSRTMTWVGAVGLALLGACVADLDDRPFPGGYETTATSSGSSGSSGSTASGTSTASGSGGMGGSSTGSTMSGGGGAGGTMIEPNCDPAIGPLDEACGGVYLHPGANDDQADGSQAHPYNDWATAIEKAGSGGLLWVCDGKEDVTAEVVLSAPITVYGGLDCDTWMETDMGKGSRIEGADPGLIPLRIQAGATGSVIKRVKVTAKDADNAVAGQSSIAVIVEQAEVTFDGCELTAGTAADGADGQSPSVPMGSLDGGAGSAGGNLGAVRNESCSGKALSPSLTTTGGAGAQKSCGVTNTSGGAGGDSKSDSINLVASPVADNGAAGSNASGVSGLGGLGQAALAGSCGPGTTGAAGANGAPGLPASSPALLDASGYAGGQGGDGIPGAPGMGGGGGGASLGGQCTAPGNHVAGAAGGGGGSGACGGPGGGGGGAAGASLALVSLDATVTLSATKVVAKNGGVGGHGAAGASGGQGGDGGLGGKNNNNNLSSFSDGCPGGKGGDGGPGGAGAGGNGGHSVGVAFIGNAPTMDAATIFATGMAGAAGTSLGMGGLSGLPGLACSTLDFTTGECQ